MAGLKRGRPTLALTLAVGLVAGALSAQVTVEETGLGVGTYPGAGLVRIDEVTVVAQTIGLDGFHGSFDDSVAVIRDLGGAPTVTYVGTGVMTPGLIVLDNGVVAAVSSGVDGQIGTLDDALLLIFGASGLAPTKVIVPLGGTFGGGAAMVQSVKTRDLIAPVSGGRVALTLSGATVTPASPLADVVLIVDASSPTVSKTYVPTSESLMRSPPTDLTLPGDPHEVLGAWGIGEDLIPSTGDDLFERPQQDYTRQLLSSIPGRSLLD